MLTPLPEQPGPPGRIQRPPDALSCRNSVRSLSVRIPSDRASVPPPAAESRFPPRRLHPLPEQRIPLLLPCPTVGSGSRAAPPSVLRQRLLPLRFLPRFPLLPFLLLRNPPPLFQRLPLCPPRWRNCCPPGIMRKAAAFWSFIRMGMVSSGPPISCLLPGISMSPWHRSVVSP